MLTFKQVLNILNVARNKSLGQ